MNTSIGTRGGAIYQRVAWTGGGTPESEPRLRKVDSSRGITFRELRREFFREQLRECGGLGLWKCAGTSSMERARIFWKRASADAYATMRNELG